MIQIQDIIYARYQAPDLDRMERFLEAFGLQRAARTDTTLYMRGLGSDPYIHVTDLGEARSAGLALRAGSTDDVERLAAHLGLSAQDNPEPAGGRMVQFKDPSGFDITVLAGVRARPGPRPRPSGPANGAVRRERLGQTVRLPRGPSHVYRLGHVLLRCLDMPASLAFYTEVLGFRISDSGYAGTPDNVVGHFLHCGLGQTFTDHHTVALFQRPVSKIDHAGYEVLDLDDLMLGHHHLIAGGHRHSWGVGRHVQGSQVFDYWRDPFGNKIEHWADGDLVNEDYVGSADRLSPEALAQWGPPLPVEFYQ